jgi:manganese/iron transport system ATP-binding protein
VSGRAGTSDAAAGGAPGLRKVIASLRPAEVHEPGAAALEVTDLCMQYGGRAALEGISFRLEEGAELAVVGPNGAGKSTLLKAIAGIVAPTGGQIRVYGHVPAGHICIAYLPQRSEVDWRFPLSVFDVVMMGRSARLGPLRRPGSRDRALVQEILALVELSSLAGRPIAELSGGEQQRMFIARALAQEADLVLLDEPLAGLDVRSQEGILGLLEALRERRITLLVALHDLGIAAQRFRRVLLLKSRQLGFGPPADVLRPETLEQAYGTSLRMIRTEEGLVMASDTPCEEEHCDGPR